GTESAGDALRAALLVGEHTVGSAPPGRERPRAPLVGVALLLGVLHGRLRLEHVLEGETHSLESRPNVADLTLGALHDLDADCHQLVTRTRSGRPAKVVRTWAPVPETTTPRSSRKKTTTASARLTAVSAPHTPHGLVTPSTRSTT